MPNTGPNYPNSFKTKPFTLNGTLWTEIKEVPFNGAFGPTAKS